MKPEQFIREFGVKNVKTLIDDYEKDQFAFKSFDPAADCCFDAGLCMGQEKAWWDICIYDLNRLVESVDRVNAFGGLKDAKAVVKMGKHYKYLKAHISNYESIYGGGDEIN